jgi:hypothetical protein
VTETSGRPRAAFVLARGTVPPRTTHALTFTAIAYTNIRAFLVVVRSFCRGGRTEPGGTGGADTQGAIGPHPTITTHADILGVTRANPVPTAGDFPRTRGDRARRKSTLTTRAGST